MQNIQVLNNISPLGLEKFPKETYEDLRLLMIIQMLF